MVIDKIVPPRDRGPRRDGFLTGRVALVTGGAKRIGHHLALALAGQGADVVVHFRTSQAEAEATVEKLSQLGVRAGLVAGDLADATVAAGLMEKAGAVMGRPVDILVNNASVFEQGSALTSDAAAWDRNQAVNLRAPFLLAQGFARWLGPEGCGDIVNLNDFRALNPGADHFPYTISKVGLHGLTRSLAVALAPRIRVNELALGPVLAPEKAPADYVHTTREQIPTGRFPRVEEVTGALLFLLENGAVTGQTLCIDGGRHLAGSGFIS
jgi:NAD(P)-dependent dehydrogenase (short-subunit alcohol dehydrogenase family)|nr:SDR family oxidoreductase [Candidatus Krumholzibacteria bacterium]